MNLSEEQITCIMNEYEAMARMGENADNEQEAEYFNGICEGMMKVFYYLKDGRCIE